MISGYGGLRVKGTLLTVCGMGALLAAVYVYATFDRPVLNMWLGLAGGVLIVVGVWVNVVLVRRRITRRGSQEGAL